MPSQTNSVLLKVFSSQFFAKPYFSSIPFLRRYASGRFRLTIARALRGSKSTLQCAQRKTIFSAKLVLSQSAPFEFKHQPLDLLTASSFPATQQCSKKLCGLGFQSLLPVDNRHGNPRAILESGLGTRVQYSALPITAGFAGFSGTSATFLGPAEGQNSAIVSAGVLAQLSRALSIYLNYDGQLGRSNYDLNAVTGGVRIGF